MSVVVEKRISGTEQVPVELRPMEWDSAFFGARMGVLARTSADDPSPEQLTEALRQQLTRARADDYAHVIFRALVNDLVAIRAAEDAGLRLVDVGLDSTSELGAQQSTVPSSVRPYRDEDLRTLCELGAEAFTLSRFGADPFFSDQQVRDFHFTWTRNLCAGGLAEVVLVADLDGAAVGFVACTRTADEGRIVLIATSHSHRGKGIGRALVAAALAWFSDVGCRVAHVKTQAHNNAALALYHGSGFHVSKTELTFSATPSVVLNPTAS